MARPWPVLLMVRELGIGGIERDVAKLAKKLDRSRFEPHVGCFHPEGLRTAELRAAGVPIVRFPVASFKSWSAVSGGREMGRYLRDHRIAVVHAFDVPTVLFGVPAARFYKTPVIIASQLGFRDLFPRGYRRLLRVTDRMANCVVVNSKAVQQDLIDHENVPAKRTHLCYNGVETQVFHPGEEPRPRVVAGAPLVIGAICALRPEKRLDLILKAFAKIRHLRPGAKVLIVGTGPVLGELEKLRAELGLNGDCVFEPAKEDVASWMRAIDIFVMSSESESFPNALLEAMASGCAVIGSRVGGIPELISEDESGLLFEPNDVEGLAQKLAILMEREELRQRLAAAAVSRARETFSMEQNARGNEALYERLLREKGLVA